MTEATIWFHGICFLSKSFNRLLACMELAVSCRRRAQRVNRNQSITRTISDHINQSQWQEGGRVWSSTSRYSAHAECSRCRAAGSASTPCDSQSRAFLLLWCLVSERCMYAKPCAPRGLQTCARAQGASACRCARRPAQGGDLAFADEARVAAYVGRCRPPYQECHRLSLENVASRGPYGSYQGYPHVSFAAGTRASPAPRCWYTWRTSPCRTSGCAADPPALFTSWPVKRYSKEVFGVLL